MSIEFDAFQGSDRVCKKSVFVFSSLCGNDLHGLKSSQTPCHCDSFSRGVNSIWDSSYGFRRGFNSSFEMHTSGITSKLSLVSVRNESSCLLARLLLLLLLLRLLLLLLLLLLSTIVFATATATHNTSTILRLRISTSVKADAKKYYSYCCYYYYYYYYLLVPLSLPLPLPLTIPLRYYDYALVPA